MRHLLAAMGEFCRPHYFSRRIIRQRQAAALFCLSSRRARAGVQGINGRLCWSSTNTRDIVRSFHPLAGVS